ncbi:hypothetical protein [Spirulina major]|uniref:hypothetical protein n=1 Tax=Spirulina major TaxID=270636 RepID=UPI001587C4FB|nr:hypothetical protein [Spirulina major]
MNHEQATEQTLSPEQEIQHCQQKLAEFQQRRKTILQKTDRILAQAQKMRQKFSPPKP